MFLPQNLSVSPNLMHFVGIFSIMRAWSIRLIVIKKVQNYGKTVYTKNMFENGWWGDASPLDPPIPALTTMFLPLAYTNQPIWLQYDVGQILSKLF